MSIELTDLVARDAGARYAAVLRPASADNKEHEAPPMIDFAYDTFE